MAHTKVFDGELALLSKDKAVLWRRNTNCKRLVDTMKLTLILLTSMFSLQDAELPNKPDQAAQNDLLQTWASIKAVNGELRSNATELSTYIKKKCALAVPEWWESGVRSAAVHNGEVEGFDNALLEGFVNSHWTTQKGTIFHGVEALSFQKSVATIRRVDRIVTVDFSCIMHEPNERYKAEPIALALAKNELYLAPNCPTDFGVPPKLYSVNTKTGKLRWSAPLESGLLPNGFSGVFSGTCSEIVCSNRFVGIWTAHDFDLCFQIFSRKTGKPTASFTLRKKNGLFKAP